MGGVMDTETCNRCGKEIWYDFDLRYGYRRITSCYCDKWEDYVLEFLKQKGLLEECKKVVGIKFMKDLLKEMENEEEVDAIEESIGAILNFLDRGTIHIDEEIVKEVLENFDFENVDNDVLKALVEFLDKIDCLTPEIKKRFFVGLL